jgi:septal ring factor EnvC (AmiA/AmiB activator)
VVAHPLVLDETRLGMNSCHALASLPFSSIFLVPARMHIRRCRPLVLATAFAASAIAQPTSAAQDATALCDTEKAAVETRMEVARSKGQMLLRRQLADQLAALQAGCQPLPAERSRAVKIEQLEKEIRALKTELEAAEEQLSSLKSQPSR